MGAMGTCSGDEALILIDTPACGDAFGEQDTVLHEVMHAIFRQQGRPYTKAEEKFVTLMAPGLLPVLQANPALVRFLCA